MPRRTVTPDPFHMPAVPLSPELAARFRALDTPIETKQSCSVCHAGRDAPKVHKRDRLICIVCNVMLGQMTALGREKVLLDWSGPDEMV